MSFCLAILLAFAAWTTWYVYHHGRDFSVLAQVPSRNLVGLFAVASGSVLCNGLYIKITLQAFGVDLPARQWLSLTVATSVLNYFTPLRGGMAMRAVYLKTRYRFGYMDFISTLSAMYLMFILIFGVMGLVGQAMLWQAGMGCDRLVLAALVACALMASVFMLVRVPMPRWQVFPFRQITQILDGWELLRRNQAAFCKLLLVTFTFAMLSVVEVKLACSAVQVSLPWGGILLYNAGQNLAGLWSITPVALGIAEAVSIYLGTALHYDISHALMIQALLRMVPLVLLLVVALPAFYQLGIGISGRSRAGPAPALKPNEGPAT